MDRTDIAYTLDPKSPAPEANRLYLVSELVVNHDQRTYAFPEPEQHEPLPAMGTPEWDELIDGLRQIAHGIIDEYR